MLQARDIRCPRLSGNISVETVNLTSNKKWGNPKERRMKRLSIASGFTALLFLLAAMLCSCGNSVNTVKNGYLPGREQTTVGDAFDTFFSETAWELKESANKTQFVEFTGKIKKTVTLDVNSGLAIPKDGKVRFQFTLKRDKVFSITYCEALLSLAGPPEAQAVYNLVGITNDGKPTPLGEGGLDALLNAIY
jgi:hypothetical protein